MTVDEERELRSRLGAAMDGYVPGPLRMDRLVRQGRMLRARRRVVMAVIAVVGLAVAAVTPLVTLTASPPAPASPGYHVTVHSVRLRRPLPVDPPESAQAVIAYGTVNGRPWSVAIRAGAGFGGGIDVQGPDLETQFDIGDEGPQPATDEGAPAYLVTNGGSPQIDYGIVRTDVAYLLVRLGNGQVLRVLPVPLFGPRYASIFAFAVPFNSAVTRIEAFSVHGEIAYAIPFTEYLQLQLRWLPAGQPALPAPADYRVGSGVLGGIKWSIDLAIGPWGICEVTLAHSPQRGFPAASCAIPPLGPGQVALAVSNVQSYIWPNRALPPAGSIVIRGYELIEARPDVSYLVMTRLDGTSFRIQTVMVGGVRYGLFPTATYLGGGSDTAPAHLAAARWTAYSAAGRVLGTGNASPTVG